MGHRPALGFSRAVGGRVTIWGSFVGAGFRAFRQLGWYNAYGLDVEILSPPHTLLALGIYAVGIGALLLVLSWQNRAPLEQRAAASRLVLFACGVLVLQVTIVVTEFTFPNQQHNAKFYRVACAMFPIYLVAATRASQSRWAATSASAAYTVMVLVMVWLLPLFPAHPMLAPIYNPVTHMVPPPFPLLLIIPSLGIDLEPQRLGRGRGFWRDTGLACVPGPCVLPACCSHPNGPSRNSCLARRAQSRFRRATPRGLTAPNWVIGVPGIGMSKPIRLP